MESEDYIRHHKEKEAKMVAWNVQELEIELEKLKQTNETLLDQLSDARDVADSLFLELEAVKAENRNLQGTVDRLRLHIQQGVEL
jgi:FtsZ-binding cell division protein ZapB